MRREELDMCGIAQQKLIDDNSKLLETFAIKYLMDMGIQVQLVETVAKELGSDQGSLVGIAITDLVSPSPFGGSGYNSSSPINAAPSLDFLVRYAEKVGDNVLPPSVIPSREVVDAALELFHWMHVSIDDDTIHTDGDVSAIVEAEIVEEPS